MLLSTPIALGFTAEIYAWNDGQVLKLFNHGISRSTVETEASLTRMVHTTGVPVPAVGEIVEIAGRFGLEYEWDEELVSSIASTMRDFMTFHKTKELLIEKSQPEEFGSKLIKAL